jgi:DNA primase
LTKIPILRDYLNMSVWEDIKSRVALEDVISEYIPISPAGQNFKCVCPFHQEKTPSMVISPQKQIWHCFGCGAGGDVFKFVMEYENLSKSDTLQKLAKKAGVRLEEKQLTHEEKLEKTIELNLHQKGSKLLDWSAKLYHSILLKILQDRQNPITKYCLKRGLTEDIIRQFMLGYAPKGGFLIKFAQKGSIDTNLMTKTGLARQGNKGIADKFSDRLMIPIFDTNSNVVGFTGRVLPYDTSDRPKYLNSPENDWFHKSQIWYGLHAARKSILQEKYALLVEGNMDVVAAHQVGLSMCIASQGTSFTTQQLTILKRFTQTIHLAFDNDNAGQIAGKKLFIEASKLGFDIQKVMIPQELKDLDDFIHSNSFSLENIKTKPFLDYQLEHQTSSLSSAVSSVQKKAILDILDLFIFLGPIETEQYVSKLHSITGISTTTLNDLLETNRSNIQKPEQTSNSLDSEIGHTIATHIAHTSPIYVAFQQLAVLTEPNTLLEKEFKILRLLLPQLVTFDSLQNYKNESEGEFELIRLEKQTLTEEQIHSLHQNIIMYIDRNISKISLDKDIQESYLEIKQLESKVS